METIFAEKATENLNAAKLLLENEMFNASASRAYYAAFFAGVRALEHAGFSVEEISHKRLQAMFNRELIHRRKIYPRRFRSKLLDMIDIRIDADYKNMNVSKKRAFTQVKNASEFVRTILRETNYAK